MSPPHRSKCSSDQDRNLLDLLEADVYSLSSSSVLDRSGMLAGSQGGLNGTKPINSALCHPKDMVSGRADGEQIRGMEKHSFSTSELALPDENDDFEVIQAHPQLQDSYLLGNLDATSLDIDLVSETGSTVDTESTLDRSDAETVASVADDTEEEYENISQPFRYPDPSLHSSESLASKSLSNHNKVLSDDLSDIIEASAVTLKADRIVPEAECCHTDVRPASVVDRVWYKDHAWPTRLLEARYSFSRWLLLVVLVSWLGTGIVEVLNYHRQFPLAERANRQRELEHVLVHDQGVEAHFACAVLKYPTHNVWWSKDLQWQYPSTTDAQIVGRNRILVATPRARQPVHQQWLSAISGVMFHRISRPPLRECYPQARDFACRTERGPVDVVAIHALIPGVLLLQLTPVHEAKHLTCQYTLQAQPGSFDVIVGQTQKPSSASTAGQALQAMKAALKVNVNRIQRQSDVAGNTVQHKLIRSFAATQSYVSSIRWRFNAEAWRDLPSVRTNINTVQVAIRRLFVIARKDYMMLNVSNALAATDGSEMLRECRANLASKLTAFADRLDLGNIRVQAYRTIGRAKLNLDGIRQRAAANLQQASRRLQRA